MKQTPTYQCLDDAQDEIFASIDMKGRVMITAENTNCHTEVTIIMTTAGLKAFIEDLQGLIESKKS